MKSNAHPSTRVDVICSTESQIALEAHLDSEVFRFPHGSVSMETQQLDEAKRVADLAEHHENIKKLLKAEKPTGVPHLFVLDAGKLGSGDPQATSVLQALASQQFNKNTAVALLPPPYDRTPEVELAAQTIKDGLLTDLGVTTLESIGDIAKFYGTVSMEKIGFLRRLFESKDAYRGTATQQQILSLLKQHDATIHPWSEEDIEGVEKTLKVSFHHDAHRLLANIGAIRLGPLVTYGPTEMIEKTAWLNELCPVPRSWVLISSQTYADEPDNPYFVILNTSTGKCSAFPLQGGFITEPKMPFSNILLSAVREVIR